MHKLVINNQLLQQQHRDEKLGQGISKVHHHKHQTNNRRHPIAIIDSYDNVMESVVKLLVRLSVWFIYHPRMSMRWPNTIVIIIMIMIYDVLSSYPRESCLSLQKQLL